MQKISSAILKHKGLKFFLAALIFCQLTISFNLVNLVTPQAQATFTVTLVGTTATQAILSYTAPDSNACQVKVSESASLTPLVHDVDPSLFVNADMDTSTSSLTSGTTRIFVVGKRAAEQALDGKYYSRALQTYTTHYYKVTCGSSMATGSFQTSNIPVGNTYHDTLPVDPQHPGSYAYPTVSSTDRNEELIDPQTGISLQHINLPGDNANVAFGAGGFSDYCIGQEVACPTGMGYHCLVPTGDAATLIWIDAATGHVNFIGYVGVPYAPAHNEYGGECYSGFSYSITQNGNTFYCGDFINYGNRVSNVLWKINYVGDNSNNGYSYQLPDCQYASSPCLSYTEPLTDVVTTIKNYDPSYGNFTTSGCYVGNVMNDNLVFDCSQSGQDTLAWLAVYNLTSNTIVAAANTWSTNPMRWGVLHAQGTTGDTTWMHVGLNTNARYAPAGFGSELTAPLSTSVQTCPTNSFGATGVNCSTVTVDGEPCAPASNNATTTPGECLTDPARTIYLQDAQAGDYIQLPNAAEDDRIIQKNGNTWIIQRNLDGKVPQSWPSGTLLSMDCPASHGGGGSEQVYWDYTDDPHALNVSGNTILPDHVNNASHSVFRPDVLVEEGQIRHGDIPDFISAPISPVFEDGSFASTTPEPWLVDQHPSAPFQNDWYLDGRPWQGQYHPGPPGTLLTGTLYRFRSNAYGGSGTDITLNRDLRPTLATAGRNVLLDISGPNSVITGSSGDNYKYCVVKNPGECYTGSSVGDVYVNAPNVLTPDCQDAGESGGNGWNFQDICIGDNGSRTNAAMQQGIASDDPNGINSRVLTSVFVQYRRQDQYWTEHATPDGNWFLSTVPSSTDYSNLSGDAFISKLPPFPFPDGVDRSTFVPVTLNINAPQGMSVAKANVQFGYAENGLPTNYYCTSRQEGCVKAGQSGITYSYNSDALATVPCSSTCTITIPSIPQRMTYFNIQYMDSSNNVVSVERGVSAEGATASLGSSGSVPPQQHTTPPVISALTASQVSETGALLTWTTDETSDTQANYGTSTNYGINSTRDSSLVVSHSATLTGLSPGTTYHYRVDSRDTYGNLTVSSDLTFTTHLLGSDSIVHVGSWYDSHWQYRKLITIDHTKVSTVSSTVLSNFPVLVNTGSDADLQAHALSDGTDVLFTAPDGITKLSHEEQNYNSSNGNFIGWVQLPSLTHATDTTMYMYYGNPNSVVQSNPTAVWDSNYQAVYQFPTSNLTANDATANAHNGVLHNFPTAATGKINGAASFASSSSQYIAIPASSSFNSSDKTICHWVNFANIPPGRTDYLHDWNTGRVWQFTMSGNVPGIDSFYVADSQSTAAGTDSATNFSSNTWYFVCGVYNSSNGDTSVWVNGALESHTTFAGPLATGGDIEIGGNTLYSFFMNGKIDQVEISNSVRSPDWITTEYKNQNSPATFLALNSPETYVPPAYTTPPVISSIASSFITDTSAQITWTTNTTSNSQINFGTTTSYGQNSSLDSSFVLSHTVNLIGLTPNTPYHYKVNSRDPWGNLATSTDQTFTTLQTSTTSPPILSAITAAFITDTSAQITWTTNTTSNTQVYYGVDTGYGLNTTLDATLGLSHTENLSNLLPNTLYYFKVYSADAQGNLTVSSDQTFTTLLSQSGGGGGGGGSYGGGGSTYYPSALVATSTPTTTDISITPGQSLVIPVPASDVIRLINDNGTYYIVQNNALHGVTSPGILASYGFSLNQAVPATPADLALPETDLLLPADGSLVKSKQDATVYLVSGRQRYGFASSKVFNSLGFKFSSVLQVTNPQLQALPKANNLSSANMPHLPGLDVASNKTVYWIGYDDTLHPYPSVPVYNTWNIPGDFSDVVPANAQDKQLPVADPVVPRTVQ